MLGWKGLCTGDVGSIPGVPWCNPSWCTGLSQRWDSPSFPPCQPRASSNFIFANLLDSEGGVPRCDFVCISVLNGIEHLFMCILFSFLWTGDFLPLHGGSFKMSVYMHRNLCFPNWGSITQWVRAWAVELETPDSLLSASSWLSGSMLILCHSEPQFPHL